MIFCEIVEVLDYVYRCGYVYNDFKVDNIVLERGEDERFYLVIIDFGKSVVFSEVKNFFFKFEYLKFMYKDSYIVLELVNGMGKFFVISDVYFLVFFVKKFYGMLNFLNIVVVKRVLENLFDECLIVKDIKVVFIVVC